MHGTDNIGIVSIGGEGICPTASLDHARNGFVVGNVVIGISSKHNPSYNSAAAALAAADGIYVDGGQDILIAHNIVSQSDLAIETASEHAGLNSTRVRVESNLVYANNVVGLSIGGYDSLRGGTLNCTFVGNILYQNDQTHSGTGEIQMQYKAVGNTFINNIVVGASQGSNKPAVIVSDAKLGGASENTFQSNAYYVATSAANFAYAGASYLSFAAWQSGTGFDTHSTFVPSSTIALCNLAGVSCTTDGVPILAGRSMQQPHRSRERAR